METSSSMKKNLPHLRGMPGRERLDEMPDEDFEPEERPVLMLWALAFFVLAAILGLLGSAETVEGSASLVMMLGGLLFALLGVITLLSRIVRMPA